MSTFKIDASKLIKGLAEREIKTKAALNLYGNTVSKQMESYAKSNAPWVNRTGSARQRLHAEDPKWLGNTLRLTLAHGVDYGVYLEFCNERKYSVIAPTINYISPKAIKGLKNILK